MGQPRLLLTVGRVPEEAELPSLRRILDSAFPLPENRPYLEALTGSAERPCPPRVAAERLGALSLIPSLLEAAGVDSRALILRRDEHGRPYCEAPDGTRAGFDFNLSHSALHTAAALLTDGGRVGVDTEELIPTERALPLIRRYCTEGERALLQGLPDTEAAQAFTRIWTVREALGKQEGIGMPLGFDAANPPAGVVILPFTLSDTGGCVTLCVPQAAPPLQPQLLAGSVPLQESVLGV